MQDSTSPAALEKPVPKLHAGVFFGSAMIAFFLVLTHVDDEAYYSVTDTISKNKDLFLGSFYTLAFSGLIFLFYLIWMMQKMPVLDRVLCFLTVVTFMTNVIMFCSLSYGAFGLSADDMLINPSPNEATFFSIMVFTGASWGEYGPVEPTRMLAAFQSLISYLFIPLILSALIVLIRPISTRAEAGIKID
jgi:hypothetical protein